MIRIWVAGLPGYDYAMKQLKEHEAYLTSRFSSRFIRDLKGLADMENTDISELSSETGIYVYRITDGGISGTLWRALDDLERSGTLPMAHAGCKVYLPLIPVRQEITEICELFDENPYELASDNSYIVIGEDSFNTEELMNSGQLVRIGYVTGGRQRLIYNADMIRYLTPPERQQKDINNRIKDRQDNRKE